MDGMGDQPGSLPIQRAGQEAARAISGRAPAAISQAGLIARAKLEQERDELRDLLGKALRIKFETQEKEKQLLEQKIAGQEGQPEVLHCYRYSVAVPDTDVYWPYEGEYWRDELGTYQYTLTKGCRPQLSQGIDHAHATIQCDEVDGRALGLALVLSALRFPGSRGPRTPARRTPRAPRHRWARSSRARRARTARWPVTSAARR